MIDYSSTACVADTVFDEEFVACERSNVGWLSLSCLSGSDSEVCSAELVSFVG
jgi:hypothetical protein